MFCMARRRKNPYAVALGRRGGKVGGKARAANMTPKERSESARNAVMARWAMQRGTRVVDSKTENWLKFQRLVKKWKKQRGASSSITETIAMPAYQEIIGMGEKAVPLLLAQLRSEGDEPDQWFWALRAITGENPVKPEERGNFRKMSQAWLAWSEQYVW